MNKLKNFFCTLTLLCATLAATAQTSHLTFKNVEINGTTAEVAEQLEQQGFTFVNQDKGLAMLSGEFASFKKCMIGITSIAKRDLVYEVQVLFPERKTWKDLHENYILLKEMLTSKYGKPSTVVEMFGEDINTDADKFQSVKGDTSDHHAIFKADGGTIRLEIDHDDSICYVRLIYSDEQNTNEMKKEAIEDL